ncbi:MAG: DUF1592 domain-containing protein [Planctomycetota bacterium]
MLRLFLLTLMCLASAATTCAEESVSNFLTAYCVDCHSGPSAEARVDLQELIDSSFGSGNPLESDFETWKTVVHLASDGIMPPADAELPTDQEKNLLQSWFDDQLKTVVEKPGPHRVRRLAKHEYRNTLRSIFGFDLEVNIMEAEQTITEKSLVLKLLPTDPPGKSGFTNDTHANPLSSVAWEQYIYFADMLTRELFEPQRAEMLAELCGSAVSAATLTPTDAKRLLTKFLTRARRRYLSDSEVAEATAHLVGLQGEDLIAKLRLEMQAELLSPRFLYRGTAQETPYVPAARQDAPFPLVDEFELAERLSYFLWADMPDDELFKLAASESLQEQIDAQVLRMLRSPKSRSLAEDFAAQWLGLDEINLQVSNNPPQLEALRSQPLDFLHYLFSENRPLLELISSKVAFVNPHTAKYYGGAINKQLPKYRKQKGIEVEIVANARVELDAGYKRGGILTMPGILAMNRSPILRGTWILERILGEPLPEPPPTVPALAPASVNSQALTFRERFERHRSQATCAVCHDKIDPLGFAFENFDAKGKLRKREKTDVTRNENAIDTSGRLPSGEAFSGAEELKTILTTTKQREVLQNSVEKTLAYALCRKLTVHDVPTVNKIMEEIAEPDSTWQDLFVAIAGSLPFEHYSPTIRSFPQPHPETETDS